MKRIKKIFIILLCIISTVIYSSNVNAKTTNTEKNAKKLVKQMESFEWFSLLGGEGAGKKIKFNAVDRTKAAAMAVKQNKIYYEDNYRVLYKISKNKTNTMSKNLFGKKCSFKKLKNSSKNGFDVYLKKGTPMLESGKMEMELDFENKSTKVKKVTRKMYTVTKKVYHGYWGNNNGKANYKIKYTLKRSKTSKYGFVIKEMKITAIKQGLK